MTPESAKIEGNVFRMMKMNDGLTDVYLGIMLIPYAIWIYNPDSYLSAIALPFVAFLLAYPVLMFLRKRIVTPRIGSVKPGAVRRKKMRILVISSVIGVIFTVLLVLATATAPASVQIFAGIPRVFWIFSACVIGASILAAWIASTPRLAVYGFLAAVSFPVDAVFIMRTGYAPSTLVPILTMIGTGLFLFVRFINKYPVHAEVELG